MQQEQIKTLIVNIATLAIVVGTLVVGYFVFTKRNAPVVSEVASVARIAAKTASIGAEIDNTVRDLKELKSAVESSRIVFDLPEFKNLQNFSVTIPEEPIGGRTNPFTPTVWKLKMNAAKVVPSAKTSVPPAVESPLVPAPSTETSSSTPADLLGDFNTGI